MTVRVAIIDSGVGPELQDRVVGAAAFIDHGGVALPHGPALARLIAEAAPAAELLDARVFGDRLATNALTVAAAVGWAVDAGARLINLSLGLRDDRLPLAAAVARAVAAGVVVVAAVPARGPEVYPAAYPHVLRVTGDARCGVDDISWIGDARADFAACPRVDAGGTPIAGASVAVARVTGALAKLWLAAPDLDRPVLLEALKERAVFQGRERRR